MEQTNKTSVKQQYMNQVQNPPGGQSSFSIGGGYENQPSTKPTAARNNILSQEVDNQAQKTSVKVAQTPGGNSSIQLGGYDNSQEQVHTSVKVNKQLQSNIFGTDEAPKPKARQQHAQQTSNIFGTEEAPKPKARQQHAQQTSNIFGGQDEPPKKPQQQQQQIGAQTQNQEPQKTSVKVHNPPGGRSNFTLG